MTDGGWNDVASSNETKSPDAFSSRNSRDDIFTSITAQIQAWYKTDISRSTHLYMISPDSKSTSEFVIHIPHRPRYRLPTLIKPLLLSHGAVIFHENHEEELRMRIFRRCAAEAA